MLAPTMFNMLRLAVFLSYEIHVIDCKTLQGLTQASQGSAIFMAAFLKAVRLIDN
jgi:pantothenate synthetase